MIRRFLLYCAVICAAATCTCLSAAVEVSRVMVKNGTASRINDISWATFECFIKNTGSTDRNMMIRLKPADNSLHNNVASFTIKAPARTAFMYKGMFLAETADKYDCEIFEEGKRHRTTQENVALVTVVSGRKELLGILNDKAEYGYTLLNHPDLKDRLFTALYAWNSAPFAAAQYVNLRAVVILHPDFDKYTPAQFAAILDYAANGGTVVFTDPDGAAAAAKTPLSALLPVEVLGRTKIYSGAAFEKLFPGRRFANLKPEGLDFAECSEVGLPGVTHAYLDGFPLYRESSFGLGVVRFLAVNPNMPSVPRDLWNALIPFMFRSHNIKPDVFAMNTPLENFTGFPVPSLSTVHMIIIGYLVFLAVVTVLGMMFHRSGLAFAVSAAGALVLTFSVLSHVGSSGKKKGSVAAVVRIENALDPEHSESFISLYTPDGISVDMRSQGNSDILYQPMKRLGSIVSETIRNRPPLELRTDNDTGMNIRSMALSPNVPRMFAQKHYPDAVSSADMLRGHLPEITFTKDGYSFKPFKLPDGVRADSAFLFLPNGTVDLTIAPDGTVTAGNAGGLMTDTVDKDVRDALLAAKRSPSPALALVAPASKTDISLPEGFAVQGKNVSLIPCRISVENERVTVPDEFIIYSANGISTGINGNVLDPSADIQTEMSLLLSFILPDCFVRMDVEKVKLSLSGALPSGYSFAASIEYGKDKTVKGKNVAPGVFEFTGSDIKKAFADPSGVRNLRISCFRGASGYAAGMFKMWKLHSASLEVTGTVPGSPLKF